MGYIFAGQRIIARIEECFEKYGLLILPLLLKKAIKGSMKIASAAIAQLVEQLICN